MRPVLALLVAVLVSPGAWANEKPFESREGKFRAKFPGTGKPKENERDLGKVKQFSFQVEVGKRAFDVTYFDLPNAVEATKLFDLAQQGAVGKDKLLTSREITFGDAKLPAREALIKKGEVLIRMVMILSGDRLYLLTAGGPDDFTTAKETYEFFESFSIVK
jgi:hypothetical protein